MDSHNGPIVISLEDTNPTGFRKAIIRTKRVSFIFYFFLFYQDNKRVLIPCGAKEAEALRTQAQFLSGVKLSNTRYKSLHNFLFTDKV